MSHIGTEHREIYVEPLENPVPAREPATVPQQEPAQPPQSVPDTPPQKPVLVPV